MALFVPAYNPTTRSFLRATHAAMRATDRETWTLAVIPDTQRLAPNNPTAYNALVQWIVDNKTIEDIRMVMHLGDIVNNGASNTEWTRADAALSRLHGEVPWLLTAGNHDYDDDGQGQTYQRAVTKWDSKFPESDWTGYSWYIDSYNNQTQNMAGTLTIGTKKYLFLTLELYPRAGAVAWAETIITAQSPDRIILSTHMLVTDFGLHATDTREDVSASLPQDYSICDNRADADCMNGDDIYANFISSHSNIILTVNGHDLDIDLSGEGYAKREDTVGGNVVNQHFFNYQNLRGSSYQQSAVLRLYKFNHTNNSCAVTTYNPVTGVSKTDSENQFTFNFS